MKQAAYAKAVEWLKTKPSLDELCASYPKEWAAVQQDISAIVETGRAEDLKAYLARVSAQAASAKPAPGSRQASLETALSHLVRSRMAHESVKKLSLSTLASNAGATKGKLRFNLFNGFVAQKLLFAKELERKPVSLFWFHLLWPLVWQKKRLMPLVQGRGIYCFYSRELIGALAGMIGGKSCLEIAAGDGTLTRFLKDRGVQLSATDNHGWANAVTYP
ncbi:MAG: hypothetical protein PHD76_15220, partial [Methylacidiphilales bacterium]|nr:hypothetical protein [Candidatus Methylacidiphilales bacterium]